MDKVILRGLKLRNRLLDTIEFFIYTKADLPSIIYLIPNKEENYEYLNPSEHEPVTHEGINIVPIDKRAKLTGMSINRDSIYKLYRKDEVLKNNLREAKRNMISALFGLLEITTDYDEVI